MFFSSFGFILSVSFYHCSTSISIFTATSKRNTNLRVLGKLHKNNASSDIEEHQERKAFPWIVSGLT
jgi:hypothetical protein